MLRYNNLWRMKLRFENAGGHRAFLYVVSGEGEVESEWASLCVVAGL